MKKIRLYFSLVTLFLGIGMANAAPNAQQVAQIDQMVQDFHFRFRPAVIQSETSQTGFVQGLYTKTANFPLWLLMDMGGDLMVDNEHFSLVDASKDEDGVWIVHFTCVDSINGFFRLNLAVNPVTNEAALRISDAEEDLVLYSGTILPSEAVQPTFKNDKKAQEAQVMEEALNKIIPSMNISLHLKSEIYGGQGYVVITPERITTSAPNSFQSDDYTVICCERQADTWYVRCDVGTFGAEEEGEETLLLDMAINAYTGATSYRLGMSDRLKFNWRAVTDGFINISWEK